ncbi:hypothetical protein [Rickettsia endosymbiont of Aspidapion aeneum]
MLIFPRLPRRHDVPPRNDEVSNNALACTGITLKRQIIVLFPR